MGRNNHKAILPLLFEFFVQSKVEKDLLRQMLYLRSQWMNFKNLNGVWKLKRFCITYRIYFQIFVSVSFVFSLNFSLILTFRYIKPI